VSELNEELQIEVLGLLNDASGSTHPAPSAWTPADDNGIVDWWNMDAGLGGSAVSRDTWTSQAGQLSVFTAPGGSPDSNSQTLNGEAVLHFQSGSLEYYEIEDHELFGLAQKGVIVMVARPNTPDQTNESMLEWNFDATTSNGFRFRAGDSDQFFGDLDQVLSDSSDLSDTDISATWAVISIEYNAADDTLKLYYDGTEVASEGYTVLLGGTGTLRIARTADNSHILSMQLYGMSITKSPGLRELHEGYWAWDAQGDTADKDFVAALPADHPYKSAAPTL